MAKMDVSIIIVNYNTVSLVCNAIDSILEKTTDISYEIIVVDNNSSDNSEKIICEKYADKVIYVKLNENNGFGKANNEGAKLAKGNYLFLLNPDTVLLNNAVKHLAAFLDTHQDVGICGGNLYDADKQATLSYSMFFPSIIWELNLLFSCRLERIIYGKNGQFNHTDKARKVAYITGADLMIRTDLFRRQNGFDTDFFMYYEETELTYRIQKTGYKVYNVPQAKITHLEGQALSGNWKRRMQLSLESRRKYYKKRYGKTMISLCDWILKINTSCKCILFKLIKKADKYDYWKYMSDNI